MNNVPGKICQIKSIVYDPVVEEAYAVSADMLYIECTTTLFNDTHIAAEDVEHIRIDNKTPEQHLVERMETLGIEKFQQGTIVFSVVSIDTEQHKGLAIAVSHVVDALSNAQVIEYLVNDLLVRRALVNRNVFFRDFETHPKADMSCISKSLSTALDNVVDEIAQHPDFAPIFLEGTDTAYHSMRKQISEHARSLKWFEEDCKAIKDLIQQCGDAEIIHGCLFAECFASSDEAHTVNFGITFNDHFLGEGFLVDPRKPF